MGKCLTTCKPNSQKYEHKIQVTKLSQFYHNEILSIPEFQKTSLKFKVVLSEVKGRSLRKRNAFVEFQIHSHPEQTFKSEPAFDDENPQWNFKAEMQYSSLYDNMSKDFIEIAVKYRNRKGITKSLSVLCLDCLAVAIGPVINDLALPSTKSNKIIVGRLQFALEFQHMCTIELNLQNIKFEFEGKHENHNYYFSLQGQISDKTMDSEKCKRIFPIYEPEIKKTYIQATNSEIALPNLRFETTYMELSSSCLKVCLWIEQNNINHSQSVSLPERHIKAQKHLTISIDEQQFWDAPSPDQIEIFNSFDMDTLMGESYLPFAGLLGEGMNIFDQKEALLSQKSLSYIESTLPSKGIICKEKLRFKTEKAFSETLWNCGKVVGKVSGLVFVNDPPFLKQMLCGVHTEEGFCILPSSVLRRETTEHPGCCGIVSKMPEEIVCLAECKNI